MMRQAGRTTFSAGPIGSLARVVPAGLLSVCLSACAVNAGPRADADAPGAPGAVAGQVAPSAATLVATDLVSVMMQLRELSPFATTLQVNPTQGDFGLAVIEALGNGGYGIQRVVQDQGRRYVRYSAAATRSEQGQLRSYSVSAGDIAVSRSYAFREGVLFPVSGVAVRGAGPTPVILSDDLFRQQGGDVAFPAGIEFRDRTGRVLEQSERTVRVTTDSERRAGERFAEARYLVLARSRLFTSDRAERALDTDRSELYRPRAQALLPFGDPTSMVLGSANKGAIRELLSRFDPATDRFSITACAHNESLLWDGTESLALERSLRVKEELLLLDTPRSGIREESCFATAYADRLRPLSVVLTLESRTDPLI